MAIYVNDLDNPGKKVDVIKLQLRDPHRELPPIFIQGWLKRDLWTRREAMLLLAGFDPSTTTWGETNGRFHTVPSGRIGYLDGTTAHQLAPTQHPRQTEALDDFWRLSNWSEYSDLDETLTPRAWLAWALHKGFTPHWKSFAKTLSDTAQFFNNPESEHQKSRISKAPQPIVPLKGGSYSPRTQSSLGRYPKWDKWRLMGGVRVFEAVALSLNIEPERVNTKSDAWMEAKYPFDEGSDFYDRLDVVIANMSDKDRFPTRPTFASQPYLTGISLQEFVIFAAGFAQWKIPDELRAMDIEQPVSAPLPINASTSGDEVGLSKREKQIRAIEAAADVLGFNRKKIPYGGKKKLCEYCKSKHSELFGAGDSPFTDAWKEASPGRIAMADRAIYAGE